MLERLSSKAQLVQDPRNATSFLRNAKKPRTMPGLEFAGRSRKSVMGRVAAAPAAEAIVDAHRNHIHVLGDMIERTSKKRGDRDSVHERVVRVTHEQVVVFDADGPIRREAVFISDAHGAAPAGGIQRGETNSSGRIEQTKAIACDRRAALEVEQRLVPGVSDLAGEKTDSIESTLFRDRWIQQADARA